MGLQFENLVLNNRQFIHRVLKLSSDDIVVENPYFQHQKSRQSACQIDYMIQTRLICFLYANKNFHVRLLKKRLSWK